MLVGMDLSKLDPMVSPATRREFVARQVGHANASDEPPQATPQPDFAYFKERCFPSSIGLKVQEVEFLSKLLRDRLGSVSPDLAPREASAPPAINESQSIALLELPDRNAELLGAC